MNASDMHQAVLEAVEEHALTPEAAEQHSALTREAKSIETRIARLVAAIEKGGEAVSLVTQLRQLETRRAAIETERAALRPVPRLAPTVIEGRLAEWRRLLKRGSVPKAFVKAGQGRRAAARRQLASPPRVG
jgi:hypothetical protein